MKNCVRSLSDDEKRHQRITTLVGRNARSVDATMTELAMTELAEQ